MLCRPGWTSGTPRPSPHPTPTFSGPYSEVSEPPKPVLALLRADKSVVVDSIRIVGNFFRNRVPLTVAITLSNWNHLRPSFLQFSPSPAALQNGLSGAKMEGCSNTFSLLVRGFLWGHKACGFALTGVWFGAKAGPSLSRAQGTGARGAAEEQAGCLRQGGPGSATGKESGAESSSSRCRPGHSAEWLTPSKARSMAAVSSFLHLLSFSDIFPKSDHVLIE